MTDRLLPSEKPAVELLYAKLKEASETFAMLRQEPYFSTLELDEFVDLAANAKDNANWLLAQRDTAEAEPSAASPESSTLETLLDALIDAAEDAPRQGLTRVRSSREAVTEYVEELEAENLRLYKQYVRADAELSPLRSRIEELEKRDKAFGYRREEFR